MSNKVKNLNDLNSTPSFNSSPSFKEGEDGGEGGFTLFELIIYLAIVSVILVVISYLLIDILQGQTKSLAILEVQQNLRFALSKIEKDIRSAKNIISVSGNVLTLDDISGNQIVLTIDPITKKISRKFGGNSPVDLTTNQVEITGGFSDWSFGERSKNIGIYLNISYKNPDNLLQYQANQTIQEAIELRGRR